MAPSATDLGSAPQIGSTPTQIIRSAARNRRHAGDQLAAQIGGSMRAGATGAAAGWTGGTYVLAAGALVSLAIGLVIAWFLLVEVRRAAA
jgi:hypothetical protein